jgi:hypothetical protein
MGGYGRFVARTRFTFARSGFRPRVSVLFFRARGRRADPHPDSDLPMTIYISQAVRA